jgi:IS30 family transposase
LAAQVTNWLTDRWSPVQISRRLRIEFPGDPMMQVSHETIDQALYVQAAVSHAASWPAAWHRSGQAPSPWPH